MSKINNMPRYSISKNVKATLGGIPFNLNSDILAEKSSKLCKLSNENPDEAISHIESEIRTSPNIFKLVARFCYGFPVNFTPENVIPISCLACYLDMSDTHTHNNLLNQALSFFERDIITKWNESIRSLKVIDNPIVFQQAEKIGLINACVDSIINKALDNPLLLGEPIKNPVLDDEKVDDQEFNGNVLDWKSEDLSLTTLHLEFYEPIIYGMIQSKIASNYIASNLYQYAKRRVFLDPKEDTSCSSEDVCSNSRKVVIEAMERLLPHDRGILPCALLSEMLQHAKLLEANGKCLQGFEVRIGRQLDLATVNDLQLILSSSQKGGYYSSKEKKYDTECFGRILKHFYNNFTGQDQLALVIVAELVENILVEVANDIDLTKNSFLSLAGISIAASDGTQRSSGGIFRAIDIYLNKHKYLTESERIEVCDVLNFNKTSPKRTGQNKQLPGHVVMMQATSLDGVKKSMSKSMEDDEDEEMKVKLEKMRSKVTELEKEILMMRKVIERGCHTCMKMKTDNEKMVILAGDKEEAWVNIEPERLQLLCQGEEGSSSVEDEDFEFVYVS